MTVATAGRAARVPGGTPGGTVVATAGLAGLVLAAVNAGHPSPAYEVHRPFFWADVVLAGLYAALGVVVTARSRHPAGRVLVVVGLGFALAGLAIQYAVLGARTEVPAHGLGVHAMLWTWLAGALVGLLVLPWLLVPGRWDALRRAGLATGAALVLVTTGARSLVQMPGAPDNPLSDPGRSAWAADVDAWCVGAAVAYGLVGAGYVVARARSCPPWERRALRWAGAGLATCAAGYAVFEVGLGRGGPVLLGGVLLLVVAQIVLGAAVLVLLVRDATPRMELALSRTVVGGLLTAGTVVLYVGLVALLVRVLPWDEGAVSVVAVAVLAAATAPAHAWVRDRVARLVHGSAADPARLLLDVHRALVAPQAAGSVLDDVAGALRAGLRLRAVTVSADDGTVRATVGAPDGGQVLSLPLVSRGRRIGTLEVAALRGERLDPRTTGLLERLSGMVAVTLAQTLTTARLEALRGRVLDARQTERRQLRRELHDGLGPSLAGAGLALGAIANGADLAPEHAELLGRVQHELARRSEDMRLIARAVLPPALDDGRLAEALHTLSRTFEETRLTVAVEAGPDVDRLDPDRQVAAYHVAVEGVWNAFRHAHADRCEVRLRRLPDGAAELVVRDDGRGMRPDAEPGLGLTSMRERAQEAGGSLSVASGETGTVVTAVLP
ncbi:ATP-binding protein [Aeromicrobium sp. IC_218]|uniref:sensor histidine kinase n=1 Tax=Aeromicrobium sp. IC_218 TaxID=2545468 RepID=UPI00103FDDAF|nr:ATP-binding protein [Aeromicrobium sp. IC_218]TCI97460.1 hypothetical protein E0W78_11725 [Aeromicrobium sp. IC_218]